MSEPQSSQTPPADFARPFDPESPRSVTGGCSRVGLIGCGLMILALGAVAMLFLFKAADLFSWAMGKFEAQVMESLPEDFSEEERRRLEAAFAAATEAVREGEADARALQQLQERLRESVLRAGNGKLSRDEVLELMAALEAVAAGRSREDVAPRAAPDPAAAAG